MIEKCDLAISKWMIDTFVSSNAVNSTYYQPMIDSICSTGTGYKAPNFYCVCGYLLNKGWRCEKNLLMIIDLFGRKLDALLSRHTLINFLVYCPKGVTFVKSIHASRASKTTDLLFKLFMEVVLYVDPKNNVHIVTDNVANCVDVVRLFEKRFILDIGKLPEVTDIVLGDENITQCIYIHCHPLYLMRQYTHEKNTPSSSNLLHY
ncbi:hypothetical protein Lal_00042707 [Lupinus albus]|nr:hypothetical protein Lal_00042707 [Lupinus albus]